MSLSDTPLTDDQRSFVESNLKLVYAWLGRHKHKINPDAWDDLAQEAALRLCQKLGQYDPRIAKFSTFADFVIRSAVVIWGRRENEYAGRKRILDYDPATPLTDDLLMSRLDLFQSALEALEKSKPRLHRVLTLRLQGFELAVIGRMLADSRRDGAKGPLTYGRVLQLEQDARKFIFEHIKERECQT